MNNCNGGIHECRWYHVLLVGALFLIIISFLLRGCTCYESCTFLVSLYDLLFGLGVGVVSSVTVVFGENSYRKHRVQQIAKQKTTSLEIACDSLVDAFLVALQEVALDDANKGKDAKRHILRDWTSFLYSNERSQSTIRKNQQSYLLPFYKSVREAAENVLNFYNNAYSSGLISTEEWKKIEQIAKRSNRTYQAVKDGRSMVEPVVELFQSIDQMHFDSLRRSPYLDGRQEFGLYDHENDSTIDDNNDN